MKLQILIAVALLVSGNDSKAALEPDFATDVKVEIKDENSQPVKSADVVLLFNHFQDSKTKKHEIKTDANGVVKATDKIVASLMVTAAKEGFYPLRFDRVVIRMDVDSKRIRNVDLPLIMRRVKSPVSLYAKKVNLAIPQQDQPVGFDFEAGDWVKPFGRGIFSDLFFSYGKKFTGFRFDEDRLEEMRDFSRKAAAVNQETWTEETFKHDAGKWIGSLALSFPNTKEGISLVDKDYCIYSGLRMPHLAYETSYDATWKREENTYSPRTTEEGIGYFLRTRVKVDEKGEIISANYSKFTSDIQFDPRGRVEFTYVFNPTLNDRNLEFNPHANLFKNPKDDERVMFP
jgi:hypothetical protein